MTPSLPPCRGIVFTEAVVRFEESELSQTDCMYIGRFSQSALILTYSQMDDAIRTSARHFTIWCCVLSWTEADAVYQAVYPTNSQMEHVTHTSVRHSAICCGAPSLYSSRSSLSSSLSWIRLLFLAIIFRRLKHLSKAFLRPTYLS